MIQITDWMDTFLQALDCAFPQRVWFVGLQGSYSRGEATETSDIDPVVILDSLSPADLARYGAMLDKLPHRELICGFLSGKAELLHWEPSDLLQFYHDTVPVRGSLDQLLPLLDEAAIDRAIKIGVCNVYHGCVHNMLCENNEEILKGLYKSASFTLQAISLKQTGAYTRQLKELSEKLSPREQEILATFAALKNGGEVKLREMSEALFLWAQSRIVP